MIAHSIGSIRAVRVPTGSLDVDAREKLRSAIRSLGDIPGMCYMQVDETDDAIDLLLLFPSTAARDDYAADECHVACAAVIGTLDLQPTRLDFTLRDEVATCGRVHPQPPLTQENL